MLSRRLSDYVGELKGYLDRRGERKSGQLPDPEIVKFVHSLIKLLENEDLNPLQRADRAIKLINTVLFASKEFAGPILGPLLTKLKKQLIKDVHPHLLILPQGKKGSSEWATYENMNAIPPGHTIQAGSYYSQRSLQDWVEVTQTYDAIAKSPYTLSEGELGWKLHLSFTHDPDNVKKGMDIAMKHLIESQVPSFKIMASNKRVTELSRGKEVTVYISDNRPVTEWQALIEKIERDLIAENVSPGHHPMHTQPINGSQFTFYRNDKSAKGEYVQNAFNEADEPDFLSEITINVNPSPKLG